MARESLSPPTGSRWHPLMWALGLSVLFFHRAVFSSEVFFLRDLQQVYLPLRDYWRERVLSGGFPQWYPFDGLGQPYVGMVISGAFHPAQLLSLVLPGVQALKWNILLCFPLAFLGMNCLARRLGWEPLPALLTAVHYTFSGYLVGITNNPLYLTAAATLPWVLWSLEGFLSGPTVWRGLGASVLLGLVLLAGDVQGYAVCCGGALLWSACRLAPRGRARSLGGAVGVLGVSVLLSAVQSLRTDGLGGDGVVRPSPAAARIRLRPPLRGCSWRAHPDGHQPEVALHFEEQPLGGLALPGCPRAPVRRCATGHPGPQAPHGHPGQRHAAGVAARAWQTRRPVCVALRGVASLACVPLPGEVDAVRHLRPRAGGGGGVAATRA